MTGICEGRIVIVTGAARGLGREYALALAQEGASVVVNDLGVGTHGEGGDDPSQAEQVATEIRALGGRAVASCSDVADDEASAQIVDLAIETFGGLHAVVNNAGFVRDRMFVSCTPEEWDAVIRVHLRGHFCVSQHAARYWRDQRKQGKTVNARLINTSSGAGLRGSLGQSAYSAAKAGIAGLTLVQAAELGRYGVTANALAPEARTRMTETAFAEAMKAPPSGFDVNHPANVAPVVVWLASARSSHVTGQVFELKGGQIILSEGWREGPSIDKGARWRPAEVGPAIDRLIAERTPALSVYGAA